MEVNNKTIYDNLVRMIDEVQDYAIILLNTDGTILNWNTGAKRIKGYDASEIVGKNFSVFYTESDLNIDKHKRLLRQAELEGTAYDNGWRVRKDGSLFWGHITINAIHDEFGNAIGFGKLTRDLTESKRAEHVRELEIKNKELEQFAYIASHDLQEPLRTVSNYVQILEEDYGEILDERGNSYLKTIGTASKRMSALVKGVLGYSRIGRSAIRTTVNCTQILDEVTTDLKSLIASKRAKIKFPTETALVSGVEIEIRQLFQNLISNAIKFSAVDESPEIKIACEKIQGHWQFSVQDNGIGIESKDLERIFIIFQRSETAKDYEGYGIGLANCKKIVEMHGGKIWVESQLNLGSTFYFTLLTP